MSVAQRATPIASADSRVDISARARVRLRLLSTRSSPTSTALTRTCASGRSGSTLVTGSISSWSASSTTHSSPLSMATGSTSTDAWAAAGTARTSPRITRSSPCRVAVSPESMAYAAITSPEASSQQLGVRVMRRDKRTGDRRRHKRSGHCPVAELGEDDGQLENAETLSANGFGEVYALQALLGGGLPVRRRVGMGVSSASCRTSEGATRATRDRTESARSLCSVVIAIGMPATLSINRSVGNDDTVDHVRQLAALP